MSNRITELQKLIDKTDEDYYTLGKSQVADAIYDQWKDELTRLAPQDIRITRVGAKIRDTILQKRNHAIPMGSQFKAMNETEYRKWIGTTPDNAIYHGSYKMDGASCSFEYREGRLVAAVSRGDGLEGEDITANALKFQGLPKVNCPNVDGALFTGFVRGEIILKMNDWKQVDPDQISNPRNLAVGIARRKSGEESEYLTVYAFDIFGADGKSLFPTEDDAFIVMNDMGFNVVPCTVGEEDDIWNWFSSVKKNRATLDYWIDGIIVRVNDVDIQASMGITDNRPKGQIAVKFEAEGAETILRSVELSVGHTGAIIPTAIFDPVRIGGTTVSRATLCNYDNISNLNINIGDKCRVIKTGDIIPQIVEVIEKNSQTSFPEPAFCPECKGPVSRQQNIGGDDTSAIYCQNPNCPGKVFGKIDRFIKSLNILGGGENLIQALIKDMGVKDAADLYILKNRRAELADLKLNGKTRLGEKRADKFLAEIDKVRKLTLSEFLGSLGIAGLGKRRVALIQSAVGGKLNDIEDWLVPGFMIISER